MIEKIVEGADYGLRLILQWRLWAGFIVAFGGLIFMTQAAGGPNGNGKIGWVGLFGGIVAATVAQSFLSKATDRASPEE